MSLHRQAATASRHLDVSRHVTALLSDEVPPPEQAGPHRPATLVVLRGAFRAGRLVDVVASLLAGGDGARP